MDKFLGTYRGAALYEITGERESEGQLLGSKVKAEGMLPEPENMKVDFFEEAENQKVAMKKLIKAIDHYLDDHELNKFVFENL